MAWRAGINAPVLASFRARAALTTCGDLRAPARRRLAPPDADAGGGARVLAHGSAAPGARLPATGWVHGDSSSSSSSSSSSAWYLIPKQRHDARRTGLDSAGLRIVLLCSVVNSLLADEDTHIFDPGCIAVDVLCPLATAAVRRGSHAYDQLKNQLEPLTIGIEWGTTKTEINRWNASHIDNDVRDAIGICPTFRSFSSNLGRGRERRRRRSGIRSADAAVAAAAAAAAPDGRRARSPSLPPATRTL